MIYLLSEEGRRSLRALATRSILYAFDFDGTLAPISSDRDAVKIPRSAHEWLRELAKRAPCAVVSGRALADLTPRLAGTVPHVIGNHGIEGPTATPGSLSIAETVCLGWKKVFTTTLAQPLKDLGNEAPRSKLRGITELKHSELPEIFLRLPLPLHILFDSLPVRPFSYCCHIVPVGPELPTP